MSQHCTTQDSPNGAERRSDRARRALRDEQRSILAHTVQADVIPVLVAMPWVGPVAVDSVASDAELVAEHVTLSLSEDATALAESIAALHARGMSAERIYTVLLTPVARRLGDMWVDDQITFAEVTLGVLRLQNAQRTLAPRFVGAASAGPGAPRVMLMPVPGEVHTFGLTIVEDFFARAGWEVRAVTPASQAAAVSCLAAQPIDLIGLSVACEEHVGAAASLVAALRRAARNPRLVVMVGGPLLLTEPDLAARVGADAAAIDGHAAVLVAHDLVHVRNRMASHAG